MKTMTIYQLQDAMRLMARNTHAPLEAKMQTIMVSFESFMPQTNSSTFIIESTIGDEDAPVTVTYSVDSDGDSYDLRVFGDQGEITKYLDYLPFTRFEEECNMASRAALQVELDECEIDAYLANQE